MDKKNSGSTRIDTDLTNVRKSFFDADFADAADSKEVARCKLCRFFEKGKGLVPDWCKQRDTALWIVIGTLQRNRKICGLFEAKEGK